MVEKRAKKANPTRMSGAQRRKLKKNRNIGSDKPLLTAKQQRQQIENKKRHARKLIRKQERLLRSSSSSSSATNVAITTNGTK